MSGRLEGLNVSQVWMINDGEGGKYFWHDGDKLFEFPGSIESQVSGYLDVQLVAVSHNY